MRARIKRYELLDRIGAGGMAEAFLATATLADGSRLPVVVKKILPRFSSDADYRAMFMDEARIASSLEHPNVVALLDLGRMDDVLFIALEYVDGADLQVLLRAADVMGRAPSFELALWATLEALRGLEYVHTRKRPDGTPLELIHRDVGLANVLVSRKGEVKLSDFGIAKAAGRLSHTAAGIIKGNMLSMAPEQISGKKLSHKADLYAAGLMLHALLIGRHPLENIPFVQIIDVHSEGRLPLPSQGNPRVHPELDAIVRRATAVLPENRFESAAHFADAIADFAARERIPLAPDTLARELHALEEASKLEAEATRPDARALPPATEPSVIADVVAGEGEHVFLTQAVPPPASPPAPGRGFEPSVRRQVTDLARRARRRRRAAPWREQTGADDLDSASITASQTLDQFDDSLDLATLESAVPGGVNVELDFDGPTKSSPAPPASQRIESEEETSPAAFRVPRPPVTPRPTVPRPPPQPPSPRSVSRVAEPPPMVSASFVGALGGHRQAIAAIAAGRNVVATASADGTIVVWDVEQKKPARTLRGHRGAAMCLAHSPDGSLLLSGARDGTVRLWKTATGEEALTMKGHGRWVSSVALRSEGLRAISAGDDKTIRTWDLVSDGPTRTIENAHDDFISAVAFVPQTPFAVSGSYDRTLKLWDIDAGVELRAMRGMERVRALDVNPSGTRILAGTADGGIWLWDLMSGENLAIFGNQTDAVASVRFAGDRIALSAGFDGTVRVWDVEELSELVALGKQSDPVLAVAASRGRLFAASGNSLLVWNVEGLPEASPR